MCGIFGMVLKQTKLVSDDFILKFGIIQNYRGPDYTGVFTHENIGLGHNRLSIIDVHTKANQPFQDSEHVLVYNGEIYNFKELRSYTPDISYQTSSDTEVLFYLLKIHGIEKTLSLIEGMFAFAFYDKRTRELVLARDRFGIKPLHYYEQGGEIYFASEIKTLWKNLPLSLNTSIVLDAFYGGAENHFFKTPFNQVYNLAPGHYIKINDNKITSNTCYFDLTEEFDESKYAQYKKKSRSEVQEEFDSLMNASVKKMMVSDVKIASMASGGIDSSVITALSSRYEKLDIFTANISDYNSELDDVILLSKTLNLNLHVQNYKRQDFINNFAAITWQYEAPIVSNVNAIPFAMLSQLANKKGVRVVLTGEGSDELFLGYPSIHFDRIYKSIKLPFKILGDLVNKIPGISPYMKKINPAKQENFVHLLTRDFDRQEHRQLFNEKHKGLPASDRQYVFSTLNLMREHMLGLLHRNDRMGMMSSIEARFPFLDEALVKFGIHVPYHYKYRYIPRYYNKKHPYLFDKSLVRDCLKHELPKQLLYKNKWGFGQNANYLVKFKPGTFTEGYLKEVLGLSSQTEKYMLQNYPSYILSKLLAIEVFGRLYGLGNSVEETDEWVRRKLYF